MLTIIGQIEIGVFGHDSNHRVKIFNHRAVVVQFQYAMALYRAETPSARLVPKHLATELSVLVENFSHDVKFHEFTYWNGSFAYDLRTGLIHSGEIRRLPVYGISHAVTFLGCQTMAYSSPSKKYSLSGWDSISALTQLITASMVYVQPCMERSLVLIRTPPSPRHQ